MRKIVLLAVLAVVLLGARVSAGEDTSETFYFGAGLIYNDLGTSQVENLDRDLGWDVRTGYNFGWLALEANLSSSKHEDSGTGRDWTFQALLLNLKAYYIPPRYPVRGYFVLGADFADLDGPGVAYAGDGFHFGSGLEIFVSNRTAYNFNILYREIKYDEVKAGGITKSFNSELDGTTYTLQTGLNFYF